MVVLTHDGREHLGPCLEALSGLRGLVGPEAILVADNASRDGSRAFLRERHPRVRWLGFPENLGFAEGNDRAMEAVTTPWAWILNNDTRVLPDSLARLCAALAEQGGIAAGPRLLDWSGRRLDFDGGGMLWTGHGIARGHGRRVPRRLSRRVSRREEPPEPVLFASGAALLVAREPFLAHGGFDPGYFAYYEDVDLGWRLTLAGEDVLHVPGALVHHRGGGSAASLGRRRARLHERNALHGVLKNYGDEALARALPAALGLAAWRAGAELEAIAAARPPAEAWPPLPEAGWAGWRALAPLELDLPAALGAREAVQARRRRADAEVIARFGPPWAPVPPTAEGWEALRRAEDAFGLSQLFGAMDADRARGPAALARRAADTLRAEGPAGLLRAARARLDRGGGGAA